MTREEIKQQYSMRQVVAMYGLKPNRAGFVSCPFHTGDRTPSMKIYDRDFHCHACGANGDIFTFVQKMDNCSFKDAFYKFGGKYRQDDFGAKLSRYRAQKEAEKRRAKEAELDSIKREAIRLSTLYLNGVNAFEPMSDEWAMAYNLLQYQLYVIEEINKERNLLK